MSENRYGTGDRMSELSASGARDDVRTQFLTREGLYRLMSLSEYTRPSRLPLNGPNNTPVRVSFVRTAAADPVAVGSATVADEKLCFNTGKELYIYNYNGIRKVRFVGGRHGKGSSNLDRLLPILRLPHNHYPI